MLKLKEPLVSLIITCHNLGKYLPECIESIEQQTYKNYEIILVDDFSDALTKEIIEKNFKNRDKFSRFFSCRDIKIIETKENIGQMASFIEGLKVSSGEFVCMVDADDILCKDYLSVLLQAHMKLNVSFVSGAQLEIDENSTIHTLNSMATPTFENKDAQYQISSPDEIFSLDFNKFGIKYLSNKKYPFATWLWNPSTSAMMRRSALEFLLKFDNSKNYKTGADKFIFSFLQLIGSSANVDIPVFAYRRHKTNSYGTNALLGDFRYLKSPTVDKIIATNKSVRVDTLNFLLKNYSYFASEINPLNTRRLIFKVIFSFNFSTIKKALKVLFYKLS